MNKIKKDESNELPFEKYEWISEKEEKYYNLNRLSVDFDVKVALISLICSLKQAYDKSDKNIKFIDLINKLSSDSSEDLKNELSDICSAFYSQSHKFNNYGYKTAKEIKSQVNKILSFELPF